MPAANNDAITRHSCDAGAFACPGISLLWLLLIVLKDYFPALPKQWMGQRGSQRTPSFDSFAGVVEFRSRG
jgi:hypothetical protein